MTVNSGSIETVIESRETHRTPERKSPKAQRSLEPKA
jgi:hypothetical protein